MQNTIACGPRPSPLPPEEHAGQVQVRDNPLHLRAQQKN